jgi:hypothetical protein
MDERRGRYVFGALLFLAGAGIAWIVVRDRVTRGDRERVQIEQDALSLAQFLRYDYRVDAHAEDAAWDKRKPLYDDAMFARLRETLTAFVDLEVAEYGDAKDVYLSGRRPERPSDAARAAEDRLRAALPSQAEAIVKQFKDDVLEAAYKASPKVGGEVDPDLPKYDEIYDDVVAKFLPEARARVARMTTR